MIVSQALSRVRQRLDDVNNGADSRWSDIELRECLQLAHDMVLSEAVRYGVHQSFRLTAQTSVGSGQIIVPPNVKIISAFYLAGNARIPIYAAPPRNRTYVDLGVTGSVEIDYIARNNVDWSSAGDASTVTYGTVNVADPVWDAYVTVLAAIDASVKEGEANPLLQDQAARLRESLQFKPTTGQLAVIPGGFGGGAQPEARLYYYMRSPLVLEVYR
jgi:hypothetical protein